MYVFIEDRVQLKISGRYSSEWIYRKHFLFFFFFNIELFNILLLELYEYDTNNSIEFIIREY